MMVTAERTERHINQQANLLRSSTLRRALPYQMIMSSFFTHTNKPGGLEHLN